jgi:hypothetical protein
MKHMVKVVLALLVSVSMVSFAFAAGDLQNRTRDIGLFGGVLLPGTISIEDVDVDTEMGFTLKAYFDQFVSPMFAVGVYGQYCNTTLTYGDLEAGADMYEFGLSFKPKFMISPDAALKPGLEIGYRKSSRESLAPGDTDTDVDGLAVNFAAELQFILSNDYVLGLTFGFIAQPAGGSENADVTWAPIWYAMAGIVF